MPKGQQKTVCGKPGDSMAQQGFIRADPIGNSRGIFSVPSFLWVTLLVLGLLTPTACKSPGDEAEPESEPAVAEGSGSAEDTGPPAEVRSLYRESLEYRNAHEALANNTASLAADVDRTHRMLVEVEALARVPVAPDPAADGIDLATSLEAFGTRLGLAGVTVELVTVPSPEPPPERVNAAEDFSYSAEQTAGVHQVTVRVPNGLLDGPTLFNALDEFERLFVSSSARFEADGAIALVGQVAFFRELAPVTFVLPEVDVESLIAEATGAATMSANTERIIADVQSNYDRAFAVRTQLDEALAHEALIEINIARFEFYSAWVEQFNQTRSWATLIRGEGENE